MVRLFNSEHKSLIGSGLEDRWLGSRFHTLGGSVLEREERRGSDAALLIATLGALGLTSVVVWADLLGHGFGFAASSSGVETLANARVFFLIGYTILAGITVVVSRLTHLQRALAALSFPLVGFVGTWLFGLSYHQGLMPPEPLAVVGLACCGAGYFGVTLLLYCELARLQRLSMALWSIAVSLFLKTVIGDMVGMYSSDAVQVLLATALPWFSYACFAIMRRLGSSVYLELYRKQTVSSIGRTNLCYLIVSVSVIIAAIRGLGHLGLWGTGFLGSPLSSAIGYALLLVAFILLVYGGLIRNCDARMLMRFQPAFLVLMGGFLLYVLQSEVIGGADGFIFSSLYLAVELFGHLASWAFVFTAIRTTTDPIWRFQGISDFSYGIVAIACALLLEFTSVSTGILAVAAAFISMVAAIRPFGKTEAGAKEIAPEVSKTGRGLMGEPADWDNRVSIVREPTSEIKIANAGDAATQLEEIYHSLAQRYQLSARETDVFLLLAQGRSRPYISNELYLADGTVKTHISHIYRKFGVHTKQEFLTIVRDAISEEDVNRLGNDAHCS